MQYAKNFICFCNKNVIFLCYNSSLEEVMVVEAVKSDFIRMRRKIWVLERH